MAKAKKDMFPSLICRNIIQSAANVSTFFELAIGLSLFNKVALLISRIEYTIHTGGLTMMTTTEDIIRVGLSISDNVLFLSADHSQVVDLVALQRIDYGTAASANLVSKPIVSDFSTLPGGGLLVPPKPLYFCIGSAGLATPCTAIIRMYFTVIALQDQEYLELLESRRSYT